ncbi:uncharacterized protein CDAR_116691 [Caerostris darwini]|uniref:Uncharacterized protein n=1 Tax=Caerostris darwini TaxID=1538125 RepID=A0AAV4R3Y8_9ARAC|nr:uncharacterized protein CDAR_116691 [Caerostris darwini]
MDIGNLAKKVDQCPPETFSQSKQLKILRQKAKIEAIQEYIQDIFSIPSLFINMVNLLMCVTEIIMIKKLMNSGLSYLLAVEVITAIVTLGCLCITLWIASAPPIMERKFKEAFYKKARLSILAGNLDKETCIKKWLFDKPEFVFSGCNILPYRRKLIYFAVLCLTAVAFMDTELFEIIEVFDT